MRTGAPFFLLKDGVTGWRTITVCTPARFLFRKTIRSEKSAGGDDNLLPAEPVKATAHRTPPRQSAFPFTSFPFDSLKNHLRDGLGFEAEITSHAAGKHMPRRKQAFQTKKGASGKSSARAQQFNIFYRMPVSLVAGTHFVSCFSAPVSSTLLANIFAVNRRTGGPHAPGKNLRGVIRSSAGRTAPVIR
jgi:hypothetical protein